MPRQLHLIGFLGTGPTVHHYGTWRHPATDNRFLESAFWERIALTLEDAKFDAVFFADAQVLYSDEVMSRGGLLYLLDPVPLAANVLRATRHLGVGVTVSTTFYEAYALARTLGTVDFLSGGRLAWNVVTSVYDEEARRFSMAKMPDRDMRYDRAREVLEACFELWDSFSPDAFIVDQGSGRFMDPAKLKTFEYVGDHVRTRGPLNVPASPQGRPVIMQAGGSEKGRDFAARFGEVIFTMANSVDGMRSFYADMKRRAAAAGRDPDDCKIFPLIQVSVAETESIARERLEYVNELIDDDAAIAWTSLATGADLRSMSPDEPLANLRVGPEGSTGSLNLLLSTRNGDNSTLTVREAARLFSSTTALTVAGTPEQVADQMQEIFETGGADGFILAAPVMPGSFEDFARLVVPVLQQRGLFRTEYPGTTLRETLG